MSSHVAPSYDSNTNSANAMSRDLRDAGVSDVVSLHEAVRTTTSAGGWVDLKGYEAASVIFAFGANGDTFSASDKITCSVDESDDGVTLYGAVVAADLIGTAKTLTADADCLKEYAVGYRGKHRYIRPLLTFAGSHSTGTACSARVSRGFGRHLPVSAIGTAQAVGS